LGYGLQASEVFVSDLFAGPSDSILMCCPRFCPSLVRSYPAP